MLRRRRGAASGRTLFIADTYVNHSPTAEQIAEITSLAADEVRRFGITPRLRSYPFKLQQQQRPTATKMKDALALIVARDRISRSTAKCTAIPRCREARRLVMPNSTLKGQANLLIMPHSMLHISFNL
jgi:malate dehydrogenase (oxaloacetate-decarboxylating)(NADP+)